MQELKQVLKRLRVTIKVVPLSVTVGGGFRPASQLWRATMTREGRTGNQAAEHISLLILSPRMPSERDVIHAAKRNVELSALTLWEFAQSIACVPTEVEQQYKFCKSTSRRIALFFGSSWAKVIAITD